MIELFTDIPIIIKQEIARIIDVAIDTMDLKDCAKLIAAFAKERPDNEQDFIDFYFHLKMEQLKNEDDSN